MMRFLAATFVLACAVLLLPFLAIAQDNPAFGLINDTNVDMRIGPDFAYAIIMELPIDGSIEVIGRSANRSIWYNVRFGDQTGWVLGRTVRMGRFPGDIPITAFSPPRNRNGRVPPEFDLSQEICAFWQGGFSQSGDFMAGAQEIVVSYPTMPGTTYYEVVTISPSGFFRGFTSAETTQVIPLGSLNPEPGVYTWGVVPYWNDSTDPQRAQQLCVRRTGGTFEKPDTTPPPL